MGCALIATYSIDLPCLIEIHWFQQPSFNQYSDHLYLQQQLFNMTNKFSEDDKNIGHVNNVV